ncbi:HAD family hydrolase [Geotalea toluenoxydans]|uniref:HAD family hydrolase n=1 Tax=Geotalea toluenoxydans TaxID=421624 RepID=UPI0006D13F87|nr:HAD family hydrolase [Geotalea toluenoxydans]
MQSDIKALIFDLDGTLYVNNDLGMEISRAACRYVSDLKSITNEEAAELINQTRRDLSRATGLDSTLSHTILALGGDLRTLHNRFSEEITPGDFLSRDRRVGEMLKGLANKFEMYIYTNNNLRLSSSIMELIGVKGLFTRVFTIEDDWRPKPDPEALEHIFRQIGRDPGECLFIGDRYDVDLRIPAGMGSAVFLVSSVIELLSLAKFLAKDNL